MNEEKVILIDELDNPIGTMEKTEAHLKALLHRAISVVIFNTKGELLLQQRTFEKYHSKGLWANTCCTHPAPGESSLEAANRRLLQEMGMKAELKEVFSFTYIEPLENGLTEHEFDHVFTGTTDVLPVLNPDEVMNYKYISLENLKKDIALYPENYSAWFKIIFDKMVTHKF